MSSSQTHTLRIAVAAGGAALVAAISIAPALAAEHDDKAVGKSHEHEMCEPVKTDDEALPLPLPLPGHEAPRQGPGEDGSKDDCEPDDGESPTTTTTASTTTTTAQTTTTTPMAPATTTPTLPTTTTTSPVPRQLPLG